MDKNWINVAVVGCGKIFNDAHRVGYVNPASTNNIVIAVCDLQEELATGQVKWLKAEYEKLLAKAKQKE
jgi:predicted dehydrogenase